MIIKFFYVKYIKEMNSSFVCINILVKSEISRQLLINFLSEASSQSLGYYLKLANIYDGNSNKKKKQLDWNDYVWFMNGKSKNKIIEGISINKTHGILKEYDIIIKSLPGYGELGLRKKDIKAYVENNKPSIKLVD